MTSPKLELDKPYAKQALNMTSRVLKINKLLLAMHNPVFSMHGWAWTEF